MKRQIQQKGQTVNLLFTMLLFLVFVLCALFTRQGDQAGSVSVKDIEDTRVLELSQEINGRKFITWIYYKDGEVRELFTSEDSGLGLEDGLEIMECQGLTFTQEDTVLNVQVTGAETNSLLLNIRSGGSRDEE